MYYEEKINTYCLELGVMTTQELAQWFGIKYRTFQDRSKRYLEILEEFADWEKYEGVPAQEKLIY